MNLSSVLRVLFLWGLLAAAFPACQALAGDAGAIPWEARSAAKREYRAVWLTTLKNLDWPSEPASTPAAERRQQDELRTMLDTLQAAGINTVLLQTRLRGDVIYPSLHEPFTAFFTGKEGRQPATYDPLQFAIDECHRRGMQCHAWMVALQVHDNRFVDPASPAVVSHLCDMVREVVRNYDVDGIHLDYLRYSEKTKGRDQWRRDNVTACLRAVYRTVKAEKPWVCVSVAPLGKYRNTSRASSYGWNAYHTVFQEAQEWLREGICDALFPMLYYDAHHFYPFVDDWSANAHGRHFAAGLGIYQLAPQELDWDLNVICRQIHYVRAFEGADEAPCYGQGASGYALFRARFIMQNTKGIRDALRQLNRCPALVPALTWDGRGRPDSPSTVSIACVGDSIRIQWAEARGARADKAGGAIRYNLYRAVGSNTVDLNDGSNLCLTYQRGTTLTVPRTTRTLDAAYALTAIDAFGHESRPVVWTLPAVKPISLPPSSRP